MGVPVDDHVDAGVDRRPHDGLDLCLVAAVFQVAAVSLDPHRGADDLGSPVVTRPPYGLGVVEGVPSPAGVAPKERESGEAHRAPAAIDDAMARDRQVAVLLHRCARPRSPAAGVRRNTIDAEQLYAHAARAIDERRDPGRQTAATPSRFGTSAAAAPRSATTRDDRADVRRAGWPASIARDGQNRQAHYVRARVYTESWRNAGLKRLLAAYADVADVHQHAARVTSACNLRPKTQNCAQT